MPSDPEPSVIVVRRCEFGIDMRRDAGSRSEDRGSRGGSPYSIGIASQSVSHMQEHNAVQCAVGPSHRRGAAVKAR